MKQQKHTNNKEKTHCWNIAIFIQRSNTKNRLDLPCGGWLQGEVGYMFTFLYVSVLLILCCRVLLREFNRFHSSNSRSSSRLTSFYARTLKD